MRLPWGARIISTGDSFSGTSKWSGSADFFIEKSNGIGIRQFHRFARAIGHDQDCNLTKAATYRHSAGLPGSADGNTVQPPQRVAEKSETSRKYIPAGFGITS